MRQTRPLQDELRQQAQVTFSVWHVGDLQVMANVRTQEEVPLKTIMGGGTWGKDKMEGHSKDTEGQKGGPNQGG